MTPIDYTVHEAGHCTHPECMARRGAPLAPARFPSLVFHLRHPSAGHILFDTGYASHFARATERLPERLYRMATPVHLASGESMSEQLSDAAGQRPPIAHVFLSHLHGDHVGGLLDFPEARVWCARAALADLRRRGRASATRTGLLPALLPVDLDHRNTPIEDVPLMELPRALSVFGQGHDLLGDGSLLAVALPGHAPGHYGMVFEATAGGLVFLVGDAAWSLRGLREHAPPPWITTAWLGAPRAYAKTFGRLARLLAEEPSVRLLPSHCTECAPHG